MNTQSIREPRLEISQMLVVSVLSGLVLGLLTLCFMRPLISLFGGNLSHGFAGIAHRGISTALINLLALLPMTAILRNRCDLMALVVVGPQMGFWAFLVYLAGGIFRWGSPPDFAWSLFGCYVIYITGLSIVALFIVKKLLKKRT